MNLAAANERPLVVLELGRRQSTIATATDGTILLGASMQGSAPLVAVDDLGVTATIGWMSSPDGAI